MPRCSSNRLLIALAVHIAAFACLTLQCRCQCGKMGENNCFCSIGTRSMRSVVADTDQQNDTQDQEQQQWMQIGDMVVPQKRRPNRDISASDDAVSGIQSAPPSNEIKLWPGGIIFYIIDNGTFSQKFQSLLRSSLAHIEEKVGKDYLEFKEALTSTGKICRKNYVYFKPTPKRECKAIVGMKMEGVTEVWLSEAYCSYKFALMHETLHSIGRLHEHGRRDRDDYLQMNNMEIHSSVCKEYSYFPSNMVDIADELPYDTTSIMHYSSCAGSCRGKPIFVVKKTGEPVGTNGDLSVMDVAKLRYMYPAELKAKYSDRLCQDGDPGSYQEPVVVEKFVRKPGRPRRNYTDIFDDGAGTNRPPGPLWLTALVLMTLQLLLAE